MDKKSRVECDDPLGIACEPCDSRASSKEHCSATCKQTNRRCRRREIPDSGYCLQHLLLRISAPGLVNSDQIRSAVAYIERQVQTDHRRELLEFLRIQLMNRSLPSALSTAVDEFQVFTYHWVERGEDYKKDPQWKQATKVFIHREMYNDIRTMGYRESRNFSHILHFPPRMTHLILLSAYVFRWINWERSVIPKTLRTLEMRGDAYAPREGLLIPDSVQDLRIPDSSSKPVFNLERSQLRRIRYWTSTYYGHPTRLPAGIEEVYVGSSSPSTAVLPSWLVERDSASSNDDEFRSELSQFEKLRILRIYNCLDVAGSRIHIPGSLEELDIEAAGISAIFIPDGSRLKQLRLHGMPHKIQVIGKGDQPPTTIEYDIGPEVEVRYLQETDGDQFN